MKRTDIGWVLLIITGVAYLAGVFVPGQDRYQCITDGLQWLLLGCIGFRLRGWP